MKKHWGLLIVFLLSYWAIVPLLRPGFFPIHDDVQVVRVQQMAQALKDGQLPVRWAGDLGYGFGYPIFNFYAPLAYYVGAIFNLFGLNVLLATKLMMVLGILLSGVMMYFLAQEFWGEIGGILSGLFYVYAPYHAVDIYVRGAVSEFWAMVFLPLVFLSLYKIFKGKNKFWIIAGGLSCAAVILSHNLTAMMITPFVILSGLLMFVFSKKRKLPITNYLLLITFTLSISAFYWLPALSEMRLTKVLGQIGGGADFREHFVYFDQLWASPWGFAGSSPGRFDGMSFMIGKLQIVFAIFSLATAAWLWQKKKRELAFVLFMSFCFFAIAILFTNQLSQPVWQAISPMAFIQYPWRFLIFVAFAASFMAGSAALWLKKIQDYPGLGTIPGLSWIGGALIILVLLFFNTKYFQPQKYLDVSAADYINEENIKWETSKISDEYLPKDFPIPQNKNEVAWEKVAVLKGKAEIKNLSLKSHQYTFNVIAEDEAEVLVNTAYFPGWKAWLDGEEIEVTLDNGKIKFTSPRGEHQVVVRLRNTPIRTLADLISLVSWVGLAGFVINRRKL